MYALDFEYDNQYLSDYGFIVCDFNNTSGANVVSAGSKITFNIVPMQRGKKHGLTSTQYDECVQSIFDICKNPDIYDPEDMPITNDEYRDIMRWLNRSEFLKFQVLDDYDRDRDPCYFDASFNLEKIKIREILHGLRLTMQTDRPFGYGQEQTYSWNISDISKKYTIHDLSDEIGSLYPTLSVTCKEDGDLTITNSLLDCMTTIKNCKAGEQIELHGDTNILTTSYTSHDVYNDFNYEFFKIGNTATDCVNTITVSIPCELKITYRPVIKDIP